MNVDFSFPVRVFRNLTFSTKTRTTSIWHILFLITFTPTLCLGQDQLTTPFERNTNYSASYPEIIEFYKKLDSIYPQMYLREIGQTDAGLPLHAVILSENAHGHSEPAGSGDKLIYFVNNGIHPGEPCGIDASMIWIRDLLQSNRRGDILKQAVILVIPVYNVGGALNRSAFSRANQNGPKLYGFRGNAKNLDLNRDFIKCDSKNAQSFNRFFARWKPDLFIDTHTSNGADYQHTMTYIASMKDRMPLAQKPLLYDTIIPRLEQGMWNEGWDIVPYVYARDNPRKGIYEFDDSPRYSSGYASLHYSLAFISEAHMLKPFDRRVESTYDLLAQLLEAGIEYKERIHRAKEAAIREDNELTAFPVNFTLDRDKSDSILFRGYAAEKQLSELTHGEIVFYDRSNPWQDSISYFNEYRAAQKVERPEAYIIPQAWTEVIERLQWNDVEMYRLARDTMLFVEQYYIDDMKTRNAPYEGHYLHSDIRTTIKKRSWPFRRGDYIVPVEGDQLRFLMSSCEPMAPDSWMAWNFFDPILQQKEHFSSYVFHETAMELLEQNPQLKKAFEKKRATDADFASDSRAQLDFIYKRSPYYEKTHRLYPIARYMRDWDELPLTKN